MNRRTRVWCAAALMALVGARSATSAAEAAAGDRERRVAELAGVLARPDVQTFHRVGAADELGRIGRGSQPAAKALTAALKDSAPAGPGPGSRTG